MDALLTTINPRVTTIFSPTNHNFKDYISRLARNLCKKKKKNFTDLNICPSEWIGAEDVDSCYLLTKDPKQPLDAIEVCNQNGGTLLQLQLVKDQQLALRLLVHLALVNSSGMYLKLLFV